MRGRGERIAPLPVSAAARLRGRRVLVFKPAFSIPTPWAYARLAEGAPGTYLAPEAAEKRLVGWIGSAAAAEELGWNSMEAAAFAKFLALPVLRDKIESRFGCRPRMSGSGSACFTLLADDTDAAPIVAAIRESWGQSAFVREARLV